MKRAAANLRSAFQTASYFRFWMLEVVLKVAGTHVLEYAVEGGSIRSQDVLVSARRLFLIRSEACCLN